MTDPNLVAETLNQALPYIQAFRGQTFVVKYGGAAMRDPSLLDGVLRNVLLLRLVGIDVVPVHGGVPVIDGLLARLGIEKKTVGGLRVTDDATMEAVEMALARANARLVAKLNAMGGRAMGASGRDGDLMRAAPLADALGRVGDVTSVDPAPLRAFTDAGFLPVVSCVASGPDHGPMNVNGDTAAAAIAVALGASKLVLLTDTDGVRADKDDPASRIAQLDEAEARAMLADGRADRGMIPKLSAALSALAGGVARVHMIDGGRPNAVLLEVFTDAGIGTMMTRKNHP